MNSSPATTVTAGPLQRAGSFYSADHNSQLFMCTWPNVGPVPISVHLVPVIPSRCCCGLVAKLCTAPGTKDLIIININNGKCWRF